MKLYIYEHCPFCIRTRMLANYKNIDIPLEYLAMNDTDTPTSLIGKKMSPILEKLDGTRMGESLDIVKYLDNIDSPILKSYESTNDNIKNWLEKLSKDNLFSTLYTPEMVARDLPEFKSQEDIDFIVNRFKKNTGLSIQEALKLKDELLAKVHPLLEDLGELITSDSYVNQEFSIDDIILFPNVKRLFTIPGVVFPKKVLAYAERVSLAVKLPLKD